MLEFIKLYVGDAAAPFVFVVLFLFIGGASLYLTPRIARWLDVREKAHPGYYDGMLESDPNAPGADEAAAGEKAGEE